MRRFGKELLQSVFNCAKLSDVMLLPEIQEVCKTEKVRKAPEGEGVELQATPE